MTSLSELFDAGYKLISSLATLGILWGVWKIAWWVQKVERHMEHADTQLDSQGTMLQQATKDIAMILGKLFGSKFGTGGGKK